MPYYISPPPMNPISRLIAGIVGLIAMAGAFVLGLAVFAVVFGLIVVFWIGIRLRVWWIRRQMGSTGKPGLDRSGFENSAFDKRQSGSENTGEVIDAEYTVVSRNKD